MIEITKHYGISRWDEESYASLKYMCEQLHAEEMGWA